MFSTIEQTDHTVSEVESQNTTKCKCLVTCIRGMDRVLLLVCETYFHFWYSQFPCFTNPKVGKTDRRRGVGERTRKRLKCVLLGEVGTEESVGDVLSHVQDLIEILVGLSWRYPRRRFYSNK